MKDEKELIRRAAEGNLEAFEEIVRDKREKVFWISYHITGNEEDSRDISQLVFIRLWRILKRFRLEKNFDAWLYRIAVNMSIDYMRTSSGRRDIIPLEDLPEKLLFPAAPLFQQERSVVLNEIRNIYNILSRRLTPTQRAIFALKEIDGFDTKEISKIMKIGHSTVRNHLFQARQIMKEGLRRNYPEYFMDRCKK
ncbi:MAG: RNA polymerase sigma factor [Acidobacteriota bacterium]